MRQIFVIILIYILSGCIKKDNLEFKNFQYTFDLNGNIGNDINYKIGNLDIEDSLLIVSGVNLSRGDKVITFYRSSDLSLIKPIIDVGTGPMEVKMPAGTRVEFGNLYLLDFANKNINEYDIKDLYFGNLNCIQHTINKSIFFLDFLPEQEHLFSFPNRRNENVLLSFVNFDGQKDNNKIITNNTKAYPDQIDEATLQSKSIFSYIKHPEKNKYAIAFRSIDKVAIIDSIGTVLNLKYGPLMLNQTPDIKKHQVEAYRGIKCDENYIYCSFMGSKLKPLKDKEYPTLAQKIHVFSWDCEPVAELVLDYDIMDFVIDNSNERIVTWSNTTGTFVTYKLPNL